MTDALTALAGIGLVLLFPVLIVAVYRMHAREEQKLQEELEQDNIERRARRGQ